MLGTGIPLVAIGTGSSSSHHPSQQVRRTRACMTFIRFTTRSTTVRRHCLLNVGPTYAMSTCCIFRILKVCGLAVYVVLIRCYFAWHGKLGMDMLTKPRHFFVIFSFNPFQLNLLNISIVSFSVTLKFYFQVFLITDTYNHHQSLIPHRYHHDTCQVPFGYIKTNRRYIAT